MASRDFLRRTGRMGSGSLLKEILGQQSPLLALGMEGGMEGDGLQTESTSLREKFLLQEGLSEDEESETGDALKCRRRKRGS